MCNFDLTVEVDKNITKRLLFGDMKGSKQTKGQGWADVLGANMTLGGMWRVHIGHATAFQKIDAQDNTSLKEVMRPKSF